MELRRENLGSLYFPRTEWQWLRPAIPLTSAALTGAPDAFLWAARVGDKLWAWHPRGTDLAGVDSDTAVSILILETDGSELAAHGLFLKTAFLAQPAQDVEWVSALDVVSSRLGINLATAATLPPFWSEALEACGLEPHLGVLVQRKRFTFLTLEERQFLFDRRWDLSTLELIETLLPSLRKPFLEALKKWNLSAGQAREVSNFVLMLFRKLGERTAMTLLTGGFKNGEEFRSALLHTAQPEMAVLSQRRIEMLRSLHIPPRCSVYGDPSFEKDVLKIICTPRNIGDFEAFKSWIMEPEITEKVKLLLGIYQ